MPNPSTITQIEGDDENAFLLVAKQKKQELDDAETNLAELRKTINLTRLTNSFGSVE